MPMTTISSISVNPSSSRRASCVHRSCSSRRRRSGGPQAPRPCRFVCGIAATRPGPAATAVACRRAGAAAGSVGAAVASQPLPPAQVPVVLANTVPGPLAESPIT